MWEKLRKNRRYSNLINVWDDVNLPYTENWINIAEQVLFFFNNGSELIYPAKSYFVALIYSKYLEFYTKISFMFFLNLPDLLENDLFFKPYNESKVIYDDIINKMPDNILNLKSASKTLEYCKKEFLCN